MIDWDVLIGAENTTDQPGIAPKSGARPSALSDDSEKVGQLQSFIHKAFENCAPIAPLAPLKNEGVGLEQENNSPVEGVAADNYCATEIHPINPLAMCLLLTCCNKATFTKEETLEAIINLRRVKSHKGT